MLTLFPLKLYTTSACHLCEEAYTLISGLKLPNQLSLVDVADHDRLLTTYGLRIPVLQRTDTLAELNWPFTQDQVSLFLKQ